jgi:hypothetical protein
MKILKVDDTTKAACSSCQSFQGITFKLRDTLFSDGSGTVKNVLVGVCNHCDSVAVLPHQSTPAVKRQIEVQRKTLESRVPAHMVDILNLATDALGAGSEFIPSMIKFYIHSLSNKDISPNGISKYLDSELATGKAQKRISLKGRHVAEELSLLKEITKIQTTTNLIKSIVLKINDDILVNKEEKTIKQLKNIMVAIS